jgi:broad specificity polyphosphatase/5'/3'-nucleotidase SurE
MRWWRTDDDGNHTQGIGAAADQLKQVPKKYNMLAPAQAR